MKIRGPALTMVPGNIEHIEDQSTTLIGSDTQRLIEAVRGSHAARVLYEHALVAKTPRPMDREVVYNVQFKA